MYPPGADQQRVNRQEAGQALPRREVYLMMRSDKEPGEVPDALAQNGNAETAVNAAVAVGSLMRAFGSELGLPFDTRKVWVNFAREGKFVRQPGQQDAINVSAHWTTQRGEAVADCPGLANLESVLGGWRPQQDGPMAAIPQIRVWLDPAEREKFRFSSLTGQESPAILKHVLRELATFSRLPKDVVEMKLRQINIHWGAPPVHK